MTSRFLGWNNKRDIEVVDRIPCGSWVPGDAHLPIYVYLCPFPEVLLGSSSHPRPPVRVYIRPSPIDTTAFRAKRREATESRVRYSGSRNQRRR